MNFGTRLKQLRKEKEISQEDFAKKIGVSRSAIGNYETNQNMPTADILNKIADILECSLDYLMCKSDIRYPNEVNIDEIDIAFATGIKGLNKENKEIAKSIIEGLIAKQKTEDNKKD